jgi:hypothetical protein
MYGGGEAQYEVEYGKLRGRFRSRRLKLAKEIQRLPQ